MLVSQFVLATIIIFIILKTFLNAKKSKFSPVFTYLWTIFWIVSLFVVLQPELLYRVANILGIGRGADLALYLSIIIIFYLIYKIFVKLDKMEEKITKIVRSKALKKINEA